LAEIPAGGIVGAMSEREVKAAIDRFLKHVTFSAQREMEKVVRKALTSGKLKSGHSFNAALTLSSDRLDMDVTIFSKVDL
jgi:bisphosphoglycerate-independent phosphoglycerate mutase (AlkP superfamily)